MRGRHM